jgi:hypothetical protein
MVGCCEHGNECLESVFLPDLPMDAQSIFIRVAMWNGTKQDLEDTARCTMNRSDR